MMFGSTSTQSWERLDWCQYHLPLQRTALGPQTVLLTKSSRMFGSTLLTGDHWTPFESGCLNNWPGNQLSSDVGDGWINPNYVSSSSSQCRDNVWVSNVWKTLGSALLFLALTVSSQSQDWWLGLWMTFGPEFTFLATFFSTWSSLTQSPVDI